MMLMDAFVDFAAVWVKVKQYIRTMIQDYYMDTSWLTPCQESDKLTEPGFDVQFRPLFEKEE
ncbi:MAG: hypothetical protein ACJ71J_15645 [Nitrososphaeraceae archaeon]